jgi:acyl transferase domain-containing protein
LGPCVLGSVKPNIGHLLLTSGMAGFIRCLLSVHHKQIPLFTSAWEPFELYDFAFSRVQFNRETIEWKVAPGKKRIAALNSFPDGGTNCHALIEEFIPDASYRRVAFSQPLPKMDRRSFPLPSTASVQTKEAPAALADLKQLQEVSARSLSLTTIWGNYDEKVI